MSCRNKKSTPDVFVMDFGKHKGKPISEVDTSYLCWMVENGVRGRKKALAELSVRGGATRGCRCCFCKNAYKEPLREFREVMANIESDRIHREAMNEIGWL